jgi:hypothetical protein
LAARFVSEYLLEACICKIHVSISCDFLPTLKLISLGYSDFSLYPLAWSKKDQDKESFGARNKGGGESKFYLIQRKFHVLK